MVKSLAMLTLILSTGATMQLLPAQTRTFKTGDFVEAYLFDQWLPCKVFKPEVNTLIPGSTALRGYTVTCVVNKTSGPQEFSVAVTAVRARAATAEDQRQAAENTSASERQPKGNTIGARYGTRDPRTCASRVAPAHGPPSAEQAKQYVICELEQGDGRRPLTLVTNVKVQVASVSHPPNLLVQELAAARIDPREPIWDIRGSFTGYRCDALSTLVAANDFARTHNCWVRDQPAATGYCFKDTFGDWHCGLTGNVLDWKPNSLPPSGF
jgi:hypothetical protein